MVQRLNLDRNELAAFLPNHHSIRQFEDLYSTVNETAETAQESASNIDAMAQALDTAKIQSVLDQTNDLTKIVDINNLSSLVSQLQAQMADLQTQVNGLKMGAHL